jgi:hypothetical protein
MGDTFEVVVDIEATLDEAPRLADTVIGWLSAEGIIDPTPTDDRDRWGAGYYRPGPNHQLVVAQPEHPYAKEFVESDLGRLRVVIGRTLLDPGQSGIGRPCARAVGTPPS